VEEGGGEMLKIGIRLAYLLTLFGLQIQRLVIAGNIYKEYFP
jgi:hypothetical protein